MLTDIDDKILEDTEDVLEITTSMLYDLGWIKDESNNVGKLKVIVFTHPDVKDRPYTIVHYGDNFFMFISVDGVGVSQLLTNYNELKHVTDSLIL